MTKEFHLTWLSKYITVFEIAIITLTINLRSVLVKVKMKLYSFKRE